MKKIIFVALLLGLILLGHSKTYEAKSHTQFEKLELFGGKLLSEFTSSEYNTYYKKVNKRMFSGWRTHKVNVNIKAQYIEGTMFSYYNDGYTPIEYTYTLETKNIQKYSVTSSGSLGLTASGGFKAFKAGLDSKLKIDSKSEYSSEIKEKTNIELLVDPGTQVDLYIYGEGLLTNGVAANYFLWLRNGRGGFEYFEVTTRYQRLEKKRI